MVMMVTIVMTMMINSMIPSSPVIIYGVRLGGGEVGYKYPPPFQISYFFFFFTLARYSCSRSS